MTSTHNSEIVITGLGVTSAIGQGKESFELALLKAENHFDVMKRPGRQNNSHYIGAEINSWKRSELVTPDLVRTASLSSQVALTTLDEAWADAGLDGYNPDRIGLVVGGSNFQQRESLLTQEKYRDRPHFLRPSHGLSFLDTDMCGLCTAKFGIKGMAYTIGGASASGQLAIIEAYEAVKSGRVDVCIAMGALMDISHWECQALHSLGAMGSNKFSEYPELACRPFDIDHDGFIYGEACAAVVVESQGKGQNGRRQPYVRISGTAVNMDANRKADPALSGEVKAIQSALSNARLRPSQIDYVNPHGSASAIGDKTELQALSLSNLKHVYINATKSITGHSLTAAGAVEIVATVLQMKSGKLHVTRNLDRPIDKSFNWIDAETENLNIRNALCVSIGFGGINTALCLSQLSM